MGVKILQLLGVLKEGVKNLILKKYLFEGDQNFTSPCGKRVKILMICHKIYKFFKSENGGQNSTCWKIGVKILQFLKKGGQYSTSEIRGQNSAPPPVFIFFFWDVLRAPFQYEKMSYQYRKSHCGEKKVVRSSHLHNGISYAGKTSLYWIRALQVFSVQTAHYDHLKWAEHSRLCGLGPSHLARSLRTKATHWLEIACSWGNRWRLTPSVVVLLHHAATHRRTIFRGVCFCRATNRRRQFICIAVKIDCWVKQAQREFRRASPLADDVTAGIPRQQMAARLFSIESETATVLVQWYRIQGTKTNFYALYM